MSTWPTTPIDTSGVDGDLDRPPREAILAAVQALNLLIAFGEPQTAGRVLAVRVWDQSGTQTYTPTAGATKGRLLLVSGGGQGGGTPALSTGQACASSGGNSGRVGEFWLPTLASGTVTIGVGGSLGAAGGDGESGGTSSFVTSAQSIVLGGGRGGVAATASSSFPVATNAAFFTPTFTMSGSAVVLDAPPSLQGDCGISLSTVFGIPGTGAPGYSGSRPGMRAFSGGVGPSGVGYGGGGSGAVGQFSLAQAGAAGRSGYGLLIEFA